MPDRTDRQRILQHLLYYPQRGSTHITSWTSQMTTQGAQVQRRILEWIFSTCTGEDIPCGVLVSQRRRGVKSWICQNSLSRGRRSRLLCTGLVCIRYAKHTAILAPVPTTFSDSSIALNYLVLKCLEVQFSKQDLYSCTKDWQTIFLCRTQTIING